MKVNKIFKSLQGEGVLTGIPMVFIRLQGCNLRCSWCDTEYAQDPRGGTDMSIEEISQVVFQLHNSFQRRWVCITGGEPMRHEDLREMVRVLKRNTMCKIEIETNGSFPPPPWYHRVDTWVADIKCPSSGYCGASKLSWFNLREKDQVKFVVANREDLDFVRNTLRERLCIPRVLVSPAAGVLIDENKEFIGEYWKRDWLQEVWEFCLETNTRFSLQEHKIVWGDRQGV